MWVFPDDDSTQNKGLGDRAGFGLLVGNNCLNNQQLTPLKYEPITTDRTVGCA